MNATLSSWLRAAADAWADWMWQMSWQVLVLVAVLTVITWACQRRSARLRHALWLLVLLRLILPPEMAFPTGFGWWLGPLVSVDSMAILVDPSALHTSALDMSAAGNSSGLGHVPDRHREIALPVLSWSMILFLLWSGVIAVRLGMLVTGWAQVRSWVASAQPLVAPELLQNLREAQKKVGWRGPVELRNSEACATPMVIGLLRPVVLLPNTILERLTPAELSAVLVHELTHLRRGDGWIRTMQAVLEGVYFFHPALWWSSSQLRKLREDACDEASIATLRCRKAYGSALVKAAEILGYAAPPLALGVLDSHRPIAERVNRLLDPGLPVAPISKTHYATVLVVSALVLLPAGPKPSPESSAVADSNFTVTTPAAPDSIAELPRPAVHQQEAGLNVAAEITHAVSRLGDPAHRDQAIFELQSYGPSAESEVLGLLARADTNTRIAAYEVLGVIGHQSARDALETAYLERSGAEQFAARRGLEAIAARVRSDAAPADSTSSTRFFARQE